MTLLLILLISINFVFIYKMNQGKQVEFHDVIIIIMILNDFLLSFMFCFPSLAMEIIPEGRHFRLLQDSELPGVLVYLEQYLPEALKV